MKTDDLESRVRELLAEAIRRQVSTLGPDDDLVETLGLDSLQGLKVLALLEKRLSVRFPDHRLSELRSLRSLVAAIEDARKERTP
jgi:acyl carrier protein